LTDADRRRELSWIAAHSEKRCPGEAVTAAHEAADASGRSAHVGAAVPPSDPLKLPPHLRAIFEQSYPRFSDAEYARRHAGIARAMTAAGADHVLFVTAQNVGNATRWMTSWPGTAEALLLFRPGEKMFMFVEYFNHLPLAREIARDTEVRWGEQNGIVKTAEELQRRGAKRVGVIGPLDGRKWKAIEAKFQLVSLDADYVELRLVKSDEEIAWLRIGAALSDAGMAALVGGTRPGMTEHELGSLIERAFVGLGGTQIIHFIASTPMAAPDVSVPRQFTSRRQVLPGDFVFCELSAAWWDYPGQVLRGFSVDAEPTSLYRDLHATAASAFDSITRAIRPGAAPQSLVDASSIIENSGFTTWDDLVHGFGGGYLPPILGSKSRPAGPMPTFPLKENMCMVVQPNVITRDAKAGVQFGELVRVTATGFESLHRTPHGLFRAGQAI
jgi:Xaa-Pro dipeptidase